jgi:hypothetical protein
MSVTIIQDRAISFHEQLFQHLFRVVIWYCKGFGRIFGPKRGEVAGGWRKLHNEELHNWYSTKN